MGDPDFIMKAIGLALTLVGMMAGFAWWLYSKLHAPVMGRIVDAESNLQDHDVRLRAVENRTDIAHETLKMVADQVRRQDERTEVSLTRLHDRLDKIMTERGS